MRVALMSMVGAEEERGLAVKESGQGPEINLKASQRRVGRSLMRFSWPDGLEHRPARSAFRRGKVASLEATDCVIPTLSRSPASTGFSQ
jgi:hypothetical protein